MTERTKPQRLLDRPEAIHVIYATPEGVPRRFIWRRAVHDIARVEHGWTADGKAIVATAAEDLLSAVLDRDHDGDVGARHLGVDLLHLAELLVGDVGLGEEDVHVAGHASGDGVNGEAHVDSPLAKRVAIAGATGYIMKQEAPDKVLVALRRIAQGEVYVSDVAADVESAAAHVRIDVFDLQGRRGRQPALDRRRRPRTGSRSASRRCRSAPPAHRATPVRRSRRSTRVPGTPAPRPRRAVALPGWTRARRHRSPVPSALHGHPSRGSRWSPPSTCATARSRGRWPRMSAAA